MPEAANSLHDLKKGSTLNRERTAVRPFGIAADITSRMRRRGTTDTVVGDEDRQLSSYVRWLSRRHIEATVLLVAAVVHTALLVFNVTQTAAHAGLMAPFIVVDCIQLLAVAVLLFFMSRHASAAATDAGLAALADPDARTKMPPAPWLFHSGIHEGLVLLTMVLFATRLVLVDTVVCNSQDLPAFDYYRACTGFVAGSFPFQSGALVFLVCSVYSAQLVQRLVSSAVALCAAHALGAGASIATNYAVPGIHPEAFNVVELAILYLASTISAVIVARASLHEWEQGRRLVQASAAAARESVLAEERVRTAAAKGHEKALAFAAHELRNPLHAVLALVDFDASLVSAELERDEGTPVLTTQALTWLQRDLTDLRSRAASMRRIIEDITDYFRLRAGTLAVQVESVPLRGVLDAASLASREILGEGWRPGLAPDPRLATYAWTDTTRVGQVLSSCLVHAVARGCTSAHFAALLVECDGPEEGRRLMPAPRTHTESPRDEPPVEAVTGEPPRLSCTCRDAAVLSAAAPIPAAFAAFVVCAAGALSSGSPFLSGVPMSPVISPSVPESAAQRMQTLPPSDSSIRAAVRESELAVRVARLLTLKLGGHLTMFVSPPGSTPLRSAVSGRHEAAGASGDEPGFPAQSERWYVAAFPASPEPLASSDGSSGAAHARRVVWELGRARTCDRCGLPPPLDALSLVERALFTPGGCPTPELEARLQTAVVTRFREVLRHADEAADRALRIARPSPPSPAIPSPSLPSQLPTGTTTLPARLLGLHVLAADDDATNRRLIARMLALMGCSCEVVDDGDAVASALLRAGMLRAPEQLAALRAAGLPSRPVLTDADVCAAAESVHPTPRAFDVILLDVVMARTDGAAVCAALRTLLPRPYPIIAATANATSPNRLLRAGFSSILEKPFSTAALADVLRPVKSAVTAVLQPASH